jgi:hypothetical protein
MLLSSFLQVDLQGIKAKFHEKYQKPLSDMVHSDTSGDFRKLLVALLHWDKLEQQDHREKPTLSRAHSKSALQMGL